MTYKERRRNRFIKYHNAVHQVFVISDAGVDWIQKQAFPIISLDFTGYLFRLKPKLQINCAVTLSGDYILVSTDPKRPELSKRRLRIAIGYLLKYNILRLRTIEVFPEFETYRNIPFDASKAHVVREFLFCAD